MEWCDLTNLSDVGLKDVVVKISGELLHDAVGGASWIDSGCTVHITDLKVKPDAAKLLALTESIETSLTLEVSVGEEVLLKENYIVAEQGDILLICKKSDSSSLIRKYVNEVGIRYGEQYI